MATYDLEEILKEYGYILDSSNYEDNIFVVKYTETKKFDLCKKANFDLSVYGYNLNDIFEVSINIKFIYNGLLIELLKDDKSFDKIECKKEECPF